MFKFQAAISAKAYICLMSLLWNLATSKSFLIWYEKILYFCGGFNNADWFTVFDWLAGNKGRNEESCCRERKINSKSLIRNCLPLFPYVITS